MQHLIREGPRKEMFCSEEGSDEVRMQMLCESSNAPFCKAPLAFQLSALGAAGHGAAALPSGLAAGLRAQRNELQNCLSNVYALLSGDELLRVVHTCLLPLMRI